jgi:hypothetical protein
MARLVGSASPEQAEPSRFSELGSLHERAEPSSARFHPFRKGQFYQYIMFKYITSDLSYIKISKNVILNKQY